MSARNANKQSVKAFDIPADAKQLTKLEAGVLMAVAMFQPVTRGDISEMFGREISRDLIAALREERLIAAGPRSPKLGAPYAYVTTEKFLLEFGFESLRDLPDLEKLEDAGLLGAASREERGRAGLPLESATDEAPPDRASLLADLAGVLGLRAEEDEPGRMRLRPVPERSVVTRDHDEDRAGPRRSLKMRRRWHTAA